MVKKHLRNFGAIHRFPGMEAKAIPKDKQVIHLLKRSLLGASFSEIRDLQDKALTDIILQLLHAPFELSYPLKDYSSINERTPDSKVSIGETWIDDHNLDHFINLKRKKTLSKWLTGQLYAQNKSLRPRMVVFWLNYFPLHFQKVSNATRSYEYLSTIMNYSMENFRDLFLAQITSFPLLEYHMKIKPAQENLHRFHADIILDHYLFGHEYTKYISKDRIKRFTRLLREWSALNDALTLSAGKRNAVPDEGLHVAEKPAIREFMHELNVFTVRLLHNEKIALTLAERLVKHFVAFEPDAAMIGRIAENILYYDYDIKHILTSILLDEQFYAAGYYGNMTKTPLDLLFGMFRDAGIIDTLHVNTLKNYSLWEWIHNQAESTLDIQTGLLTDFFSKADLSDHQLEHFRQVLQTELGYTGECRNGKVLGGLVEKLARHYLDTPAHHYH